MKLLKFLHKNYINIIKVSIFKVNKQNFFELKHVLFMKNVLELLMLTQLVLIL